MAKEWVLNIVTNRWGLNKKTSVGPVSLWIRECDPDNVRDWEHFYHRKLGEMLAKKDIDLSPQEYLEDLGRKLYMKITEVIQAEIDTITEQDCLGYIYDLVIRRTFDGYQTEIKAIYGRLELALKVPIKPAPDEWDRLYNVDFYIEIRGNYIGLQIKPITYEQTPEIYKWKDWLGKTHNKFNRDKGGKVFIVFSIRKDDTKTIYNPEVVDEIKREIERLSMGRDPQGP